MKHIKLFEQFVAEAKSFLFSFDYNTDESVVTEAVEEVVLSNRILNFLEERGVIKASDSQKIHKDLTAFLKKNLNESTINESPSSEEIRIAMLAVSKQKKYRRVTTSAAVNDLMNSLEVIARDIKNGKIKDESVNESEEINEARSIEKIEKDRTRVINDMAEIVTNWKAAKQSGDKQAETSFLQKLKDLTAEKNGLEKELNTAIASKDRFIELVISENNVIFEGVMSEIDLLAREAKNFKDFLKAFKTDNRYKGLDTAGDVKEFEAWLKSIYDNAKMDESEVNEGESVNKSIHDHWADTYGEDFIKEYPKVAKILKNRPNVDRKELARIWDEVYGEDFKEKYSAMWDKLD